MKKKILLFPNNTLITLFENSLVIKGKFNTFTLPLFKNDFYNLFYNFNKISIRYQSNDFNYIIFYYSNNKKNYLVNYLINLIKKYIEISSLGYLNILQLWGIGYKIAKKDHLSILNLGYSHSICIIDDNNVYSKPFENIYIYNTSTTKQLLLQSTTKYKRLRNKDPYKGKGIRLLNEKITLKIGKKD